MHEHVWRHFTEDSGPFGAFFRGRRHHREEGRGPFDAFCGGRGGHRGSPGGGRGHGGRGGGEGGRGAGGPFGFGPGGFGPFGPGFPWGPFRRGTRARRGDIRAGILALLKESSRNGYQIMQELEQRSQGLWRPSPGSIYPALQQLEDEGLVKSESAGVGRTFQLTDAGRAYVEAHADEIAAPWDAMAGTAGDGLLPLVNLTRQVLEAAVQVAHTGTAAQQAEAQKILSHTRRALYHLLADDASSDE